MADGVRYEILGAADVVAVAAAVCIYEEAIPSSERKPRAVFEQMIGRADYRCVVARVSDDRVIGFAMLYLPTGEDFSLLEYLAVDAAARGGGIGAGLFAITVSLLESSRFMLLEVESDRIDDADGALRQRRLAFYRRLGCLRIEGVMYLLPLHVAGTPPVMDLLVYLRTPPSSMDRRTVRRWLSAIYRDVYGQSVDDPRIDQMLAGLPDKVLLL